MDKLPLTANQKKVLEFIIKAKAKTGSSPTLLEIQDHFGFSAIGSVQDYLEVLQKKEYIRRSPKARDIEVLDHANIEVPFKDTVRLPVVGQVAAGTPVLAQENLTGYFHVDKSLIRSRNAFLLRVKGESMKNAHILDGDIVVVQPQKDCQNGEIAVCLLEDEATVKRFYRKQNYIELRPENDAMKSILVKSGQPFSVLGKVTGVIRVNV